MRFMIAIFLIAAAFSCSDKNSPPSPEFAEKIITEFIRDESDGLLTVESFEKTNGVMREMFGQKIYVMNYSTTTKSVEDCYSFHGHNLSMNTGPAPENPYPDLFPKGNPNVALFPKGTVTKIDDEIRFQKTEKGWTYSTSLGGWRIKGNTWEDSPSEPRPRKERIAALRKSLNENK